MRHSFQIVIGLVGLIAPMNSVLEAHPLQAEPINHAYVFKFDQFNLPEDPDEHVIEGGYLLLAELNCTACHIAEGMAVAAGSEAGTDTQRRRLSAGCRSALALRS